MTIDAFKLTLESALDNLYTDDSPSYESARVLLLHWDPAYDTDDEDYTIAELALQLAKVFRESYKYSVKTQILGSSGKRSPISSHNRPDPPSNGADGGHTLVIVYYIGQGDMVGNDLYIYPSQVHREQEINFTEVYSNATQDSKMDILTFLDCPYFGDIVGTMADPGRTREIMAATADIKTISKGRTKSQDWPFTTSLIGELQHAADTKQILTTPQLYARIAANTAQGASSEDEAPPTSRLPLHLHNYHHDITQIRRPIHLSPLNKSRPPPTPILPPGSTWKPSPYPLLLHQPLTVLLSVSLHGHNHHSLQQSLRNWAYKQSSSPISLGPIDRIRIIDAYQFSPTSSTLLFQVPLDVWDTLPSHPAIQFLTFNMANPHSIPMQPSPCLSETSSTTTHRSKSSKGSSSPPIRSEINGKYRISWLRLPPHVEPSKPSVPRDRKIKSRARNKDENKEKPSWIEGVSGSDDKQHKSRETPRSGLAKLTVKEKTVVKVNKVFHRLLKTVRRRCLVPILCNDQIPYC